MIGQDLEKQIEVHKLRKEMYTTEREYLIKKMIQGPAGYKPISYEGLPHATGGTHSLDIDVKELEHYQNMIDLEDWAIDSLTKQLEGINKDINELKGLDCRVKYLRDYKGLRLQEIADELGYSIDRIKQVSCRNPKGTN